MRISEWFVVPKQALIWGTRQEQEENAIPAENRLRDFSDDQLYRRGLTL